MQPHADVTKVGTACRSPALAAVGAIAGAMLRLPNWSELIAGAPLLLLSSGLAIAHHHRRARIDLGRLRLKEPCSYCCRYRVERIPRISAVALYSEDACTHSPMDVLQVSAVLSAEAVNTADSSPEKDCRARSVIVPIKCLPALPSCGSPNLGSLVIGSCQHG